MATEDLVTAAAVCSEGERRRKGVRRAKVLIGAARKAGADTAAVAVVVAPCCESLDNTVSL